MRKRSYIAVVAVTALLVLALDRPALRAGQSQEVMTSPLINRVVVIDPGHGGPDPGCVGYGNNLEDEVVLSLGLQLREFLEYAGVRVIMTRTTDTDLSGMTGLTRSALNERKRKDLRARVAIFNGSGADVALSIHANCTWLRSKRGAQTFYYSENGWVEQSRRLAVAVQSELRQKTETNWLATWRTNQFILREAELPAVNVEVGFLSNPSEERLLGKPDYRRRLAWAMFIGTARYLVEGRLPPEASPRGKLYLLVWEAAARADGLAAAQPNLLVLLLPRLICSAGH